LPLPLPNCLNRFMGVRKMAALGPTGSGQKKKGDRRTKKAEKRERERESSKDF